jgi:hypothetical protein
MQEPLDKLSVSAQLVYTDLEEHPEENRWPEAIAESLGGRLTPGQVADALRELEAAKRATVAMGGWSILS